MLMDRGSYHVCIILYLVNSICLLVQSKHIKPPPHCFVSFAFFSHHSANPRAVEDFAGPREGWCWALKSWGSEHWLRTVPQSSTGHWWWKLNWEQGDWDGEFLSSVRTSWVSEGAQQQGMRPRMRQGWTSTAPGGQSWCRMASDWFKLWT